MIRNKIIAADITMQVSNAFKYFIDSIKAVIQRLKSAATNVKLYGRRWFYWLTGNQQAQQALIQEDMVRRHQETLEQSRAELQSQIDRCNDDVLRIELIIEQFEDEQHRRLVMNFLGPLPVITDRESLERAKEFVIKANAVINGLGLLEDLAVSIPRRRTQARRDINNVINQSQAVLTRALFVAFETMVMAQQTQFGQLITIRGSAELRNFNTYVTSARGSYLRNATDNQAILSNIIATPFTAMALEAASRFLPLASYIVPSPVDTVSRYYNNVLESQRNSNQFTSTLVLNKLFYSIAFMIAFDILANIIFTLNKHVTAPVVWDLMLAPRTTPTPFMPSGGPARERRAIQETVEPAINIDSHEDLELEPVRQRANSNSLTI